MHSNLAKHLHSEECVILINEYETCNKQVTCRECLRLASPNFSVTFFCLDRILIYDTWDYAARFKLE